MICFECDSDEALARSLGFTRKQRHHSGNKGAVCNDLKNGKDLKGFVDEDPGNPQPKYIQGLETVEERQKEKIIKLRDKKRSNILIMLCPRLEEWIIGAVKEAGKTMNDFGGLPDDPDELRKEIGYKPAIVDDIIKGIHENSNRVKTLRDFLS